MSTASAGSMYIGIWNFADLYLTLPLTNLIITVSSMSPPFNIFCRRRQIPICHLFEQRNGFAAVPFPGSQNDAERPAGLVDDDGGRNHSQAKAGTDFSG